MDSYRNDRFALRALGVGSDTSAANPNSIDFGAEITLLDCFGIQRLSTLGLIGRGHWQYGGEATHEIAQPSELFLAGDVGDQKAVE